MAILLAILAAPVVLVAVLTMLSKLARMLP